jgi:hypothetical protein
MPTYLWAAIEGVLRDKLAQAMALAVPKPDINLDTLESLIPEIEEPNADKPSSNTKPETKKIDYGDVVKEKHEELNKIDSRYSRTDVQRILKSYKEIYDGSNATINLYTSFSEDSEGNLKPNKSTITRTKGTPEEFKSKMDEVIGSLDKKDNSIKYEKIKKTSAVVGGTAYKRLKNKIKEKEPNQEVVIIEKIKPKTFMI